LQKRQKVYSSPRALGSAQTELVFHFPVYGKTLLTVPTSSVSESNLDLSEKVGEQNYYGTITVNLMNETPFIIYYYDSEKDVTLPLCNL